MKRLIVLTGMFLALPWQSAHAAVSPAVDQILARADSGIQDANGGPLMTFLEQQLPSWSQNILTQVLTPVDTRVQVIAQRDSLQGRTSCLETDLYLIDQKLNDIRIKMNTALSQKKAFSILQLSSVHQFLTVQREQLQAGALQPSVRDTNWNAKQYFETQAPPATADLCYFTSDYLPPSTEGYGCDSTALNKAKAAIGDDNAALSKVMAGEAKTLESIENALGQYRASTQNIVDLQQQIDLLIRGNTAAPPPAQQPRAHKTIAGCNAQSQIGEIFQSVRGPFSLHPAELELLQSFIEARKSAEKLRPYSQSIIFNDTEEFLDIAQQYAQNEYLQFSTDQARLEAATFAKGADGALQIQESLTVLQKAIGRLGTLGTSKDIGLRGFVRDFAYFLLRTCQGRQCDEKLKGVIDIALRDECFPYVSGEYLKATEGDPQWEKCRRALQGTRAGTP